MDITIKIKAEDAEIVSVYVGDIEEYIKNIIGAKVSWATDQIFGEYTQYQPGKVLPDIKRAFAYDKAVEIKAVKNAS